MTSPVQIREATDTIDALQLWLAWLRINFESLSPLRREEQWKLIRSGFSELDELMKRL